MQGDELRIRCHNFLAHKLLPVGASSAGAGSPSVNGPWPARGNIIAIDPATDEVYFFFLCRSTNLVLLD